MNDAATDLDWAAFRAAMVRWFRQHLPRAVVMSAVMFAVSYLVNLVVMAFRWDGFRAPGGQGSQFIPAQGSFIHGSLFWAALTSFSFALFAYGRRVGWEKLRQDVFALPSQVAAALSGDQRRTTVATLSWAAGLSLVIGVAMTPVLGALAAAFVVVFASTPLAQLLSGVMRRLWMTLVLQLAPEGTRPGTDVGGALATAAGTAAGMGLVLVVDVWWLKLLLGLAAAAVAYRYATDAPAPGAMSVLLLVLAAVGLSELLELGIAFADDGGWGEYCLANPDCNVIDYLRSEGATAVQVRAVSGAIAAGVGAPVGAALGELLAGFGLSPDDLFGPGGGHHDGPGGGSGAGDDGPPAPAEQEVGRGTHTVTLTGEAARQALQGQVGDEIDIPEGEQWGLAASGEGGRVAQGHIGERGRITGFGPVVTGPDGEIVISVEVETDGPTLPDVDTTGLPTETTPPRPTAPPPSAPSVPTDAPPPDVPAPADRSGVTSDAPPPDAPPAAPPDVPPPGTPPPGSPPGTPPPDTPAPGMPPQQAPTRPDVPPPVVPEQATTPGAVPTDDVPDSGEVDHEGTTPDADTGREPTTAEDSAAEGARPPGLADDEIVFDDGTTRQERLDRLRRDEARAAAANSWWGWTRATLAETMAGISQEVVTELPGQIYDAGAAGLEMAGDAFDAVTDPENLRVVAEGTAETIADAARLLAPPGLVDDSDVRADLEAAVEAAREAVEDAGTIAGTLYAAAEQDPAGAARAIGEAVINKENWDQAMDPETPVLERMGRAAYGAVDGVATLGGLGSAGLSAIDKTGDMLRGARALDRASEAAQSSRVLDDMARAASAGVDAPADVGRAAGLADEAAAATSSGARGAGLTDDAATAATSGTRGSSLTDDAARAADDATAPVSRADETLAASDEAAATRRGADTAESTPDLGARADGPAAGQAPGEARVAGGPGRVDGPNRETYGVPEVETGSDYVRNLPEGAIIDSNRITDTGYTGAQLHGRGELVETTAHDGSKILVREEMGLRDLTRKHGVTAETRTTNFDSMRHVRDGTAVPKPLPIKPKTIQRADTYIGASKGDEGLVGFFEPRRPDPLHPDFQGSSGQELYAKVQDRYDLRMQQYREKLTSIQNLEADGVAHWDRRRGVLLDVETGKPYAGDIDPVVFRDAETQLPVSRERYEAILRDYTDPTNAIGGQHGAEYEVVRDLTGNLTPGTPEYESAVRQAADLHESLSQAQHTEVTVRMGPDGVLRRSQHYGGQLPMGTTPGIDDVLGGR